MSDRAASNEESQRRVDGGEEKEPPRWTREKHDRERERGMRDLMRYYERDAEKRER